jgi:hypothetical protein
VLLFVWSLKEPNPSSGSGKYNKQTKKLLQEFSSKFEKKERIHKLKDKALK